MRTTAFLAEQRQIVAELDALRAEAGALKRLRILLDQGIPSKHAHWQFDRASLLTSSRQPQRYEDLLPSI